jgi:hypothetical protein
VPSQNPIRIQNIKNLPKSKESFVLPVAGNLHVWFCGVVNWMTPLPGHFTSKDVVPFSSLRSIDLFH